MTFTAANSGLRTHEVENQPDNIGDRNLLSGDRLLASLIGDIGEEPLQGLREYAGLMGTAEMALAARDANRHTPELVQFDRGGRRLDEVRFHPAYHRFMEISQGAGYAALPWEEVDHGHLRHAAMVYLASQVEPGHCCPLTMTYAAIPVLDASADPAVASWKGPLLSRNYDPRVAPIADKAGALVGMALTEKQGGSDVRANSTRAEPDGDAWRLTGHKWFCSAPMSDGFLTLARTPDGLSCFLVPRWLDGSRNGIQLMRLKDKLGNRSNASAEIEYVRALAWQIGETGRGVQTIVEMIHHTRLDTAMAPAGLMRGALEEALHWVTHRTAFQKRLIDQPLMRRVLADLVLDWAGSLALGLHVARAFDGSRSEDALLARIGVALAKYLSNKLCPPVVGEAMEILGGMGYVEDTRLPLLYREAPLNGIWEGSGNVICLDALRTMRTLPDAGDVLDAELDAARAVNRSYDAALGRYRETWAAVPEEADARAFVEQTATLLAASALLRSGPADLSEAFAEARLGAERGRTFGTTPGLNADAILSAVTAVDG